jgi:hypothetical protein
MSAHYSISVEPDRDLVRIEMSGFFTPDEVTAFLDAQRAAHRQLKCAPNQHLTLNDISAMKVQPQDTVAAFRSVLDMPEFHSRRLAFVVSRTLARSQVMRALNGRDAQCFENRVAAERWLLSADRAAAA